MTDLFVAFGLLLVIEGCLYALFPNGMKRVIVAVIDVSPEIMRVTGLIAAVVGLGVVWVIRG